ncbi:MAG TPA: cupin domain-containing protein [Cellvibrio sp.]|nr:cupin domain-containing protein [Cellvibrio sp.]
MMKITDFRPLLDNDSSEEPYTPVVLHGRELEELLTPFSCEEFANSYFARKSLNVEGQPQKFNSIFSWEKLRHALARGQHISDRRYNITASFAGGEDSSSTRHMMTAYHNQVIDLLNAGATICITNIHMADPFLARWAQAIRTQLNFTGTVGVNCYVSADGSGLPMHYDKRVATTLQIAGKKRWKFSVEAAKAWPSTNEVYQEGQVGEDIGKLPADMEFREVELNPGDLLCLPAGAWHSARGIGFSLALNLYFAPRNLFDQFIPLLQSIVDANENWRGGPPVTIEKTQGKMPTTIATYLRERIEEFHKMTLEIIDNPDSLAEPWLTSLTHAPYTGWQPDPLVPIPEVTIDQRFRVVPSSLRFIEIQDELIVRCDNGTIKFPVNLAPMLKRLSSKLESFTIPEVLAWQELTDGLSPHEIMFYLKALYKNGILKAL